MSPIGNSPVIFLDEPMAELDPEACIKVWHVVKELAGYGTTVLFTTQYLDEPSSRPTGSRYSTGIGSS
ncbi:hypothetical protein [Streptomyces sp. NPDC093544]|uniref:hypothetical protein n=1 Tax=Streptomyces sp. NPDC093544 TaxID=3155200 RepID=UPI003442C7C3